MPTWRRMRKRPIPGCECPLPLGARAPGGNSSGLDLAVGDQPGDRFLDGGERGVAGPVADQPLGLRDAAGRAPGDVLPGRCRLLGGVADLPLVEREEGELCLAAEPG